MALSSWLRYARASLGVGALVATFGGCFALYDFAGDGEGGGGNPNGKAAGESCEKAGDCKSNFCVDDVCCDGACAADCQGCVAAKTGEPDGQCAPVQDETDPNGDCQPEGATSCGNTGTCFGGECQKHPEGILCAASSCEMSVKTPASTCDGLGTCASGEPVTCANGCDGTVCSGDCVSDEECSGNEYCDPLTNACVPKLGLGEACQQKSACDSGECVENVCCNEACSGLCKSCRGGQTGLATGTCGFAKVGKDPDEECAEGVDECGGTGFCDGGGACDAPEDNTPCGMQSCTGDMEIASRCVGGICSPDITVPCGNYRCDAQSQACLTSCSSTVECVPPAVCTQGGECRFPDGTTCGDDNECESTHCTDGRCCNQSCEGTCEKCSSAGECGKVTGAADDCSDSNDNCCGSSCSATGTCP